MNRNQRTRQYLTCEEVALHLGLGKRRRSRRGGKELPESERLARPVRNLIKIGKLKAIKIDSGEWRVREDWLEEYEARLFIRSERDRLDRLEGVCGQEKSYAQSTSIANRESSLPHVSSIKSASYTSGGDHNDNGQAA